MTLGGLFTVVPGCAVSGGGRMIPPVMESHVANSIIIYLIIFIQQVTNEKPNSEVGHIQPHRSAL